MKNIALGLLLLPLLSFGQIIQSKVFPNLTIHQKGDELFLLDAEPDAERDTIFISSSGNLIYTAQFEPYSPMGYRMRIFSESISSPNYAQIHKDLSFASKGFGIVKMGKLTYVYDFQKEEVLEIEIDDFDPETGDYIYTIVRDTIQAMDYSALVKKKDTVDQGFTYTIPTNEENVTRVKNISKLNIEIESTINGKDYQFKTVNLRNDPLGFARTIMGDQIQEAEWATPELDSFSFIAYLEPMWLKIDEQWHLGFVGETMAENLFPIDKGFFLSSPITTLIINDSGMYTHGEWTEEGFVSFIGPYQCIELDDWSGEYQKFTEKEFPREGVSQTLLHGDSLVINDWMDYMDLTTGDILPHDTGIVYNTKKQEMVYNGSAIYFFGDFIMQSNRDGTYTVGMDGIAIDQCNYFEIINKNLIKFEFTDGATMLFDANGDATFQNLSGELSPLNKGYLLETVDYWDEEYYFHTYYIRIWNDAGEIVIDTNQTIKENWHVLNEEYGIFYTNENYIGFVHSDGSTIVEPIIEEFWDVDEVGLVYRYSTKQGWGLLSYKGEILHEANLSSDAVYDIAREWIDKMQNEE